MASVPRTEDVMASGWTIEAACIIMINQRLVVPTWKIMWSVSIILKRYDDDLTI